MKQKTPKLVLVLTCLLFCYGFMVGGQQLVLTTVCDQFGIGVVGMGTMVAILHVASMLTPGIMGAVADRIGKKKVLVTFTVLYGIGCLVAASSGVLFQFVVAMLVIGGDQRILGVAVGLVGMIGIFAAYPIHRKAVKKAKKKYVPRIMELTKQLTAEEK